MHGRAKKWLWFCLRWGIAFVGMYIVISNISLYDSVYVLNSNQTALVRARLLRADGDNYTILHPDKGEITIDRYAPDGVYEEPDQKHVEILHKSDGRIEFRRLIAIQLPPEYPQRLAQQQRNPAAIPATAQRFVVANDELQMWYDRSGWWYGIARKLRFVGPPAEGKGQVVYWANDPKRNDAIGVVNYKLTAARPVVQVGVLTLVRGASPLLLLAALAIFPITFILTSVRWHKLLQAVDIFITTGRTFVLNMVGAFYNTFMPGSTGGDILKAYYASKQTTHRTRAVMTVIIDRIIGLLALVIVGGIMAAYEWMSVGSDVAVGRLCRQIAYGSGLIMAITIGGLIVYYTPLLRKITLLDWIIARLPMQAQIQHAMDVMEMYRRRPMLILWATVITFPVHLTVALSAMLAGQALHLHIHPLFYFVAVPVIVLAGSVPVSPQGAGVMEYFAIKLTEKQGASVSEAFALAMAIRLTQILWNLTGGLFVLRGGYHAPTAAEKQELESDA